ncbi:MAG TPA: hypothetical protein VHT49_03275 [Acidimicrobiales bacterium]|nr:hypothetical protein [Acidimicrobiales bacterium]
MTTEVLDRFAAARAVADAVLYEGYVLYPYRASSRKNQIRWQFGVLTPRAFSEADGSERWSMRTECLIDPGLVSQLSIRIRCLQVQHRAVEVAGDDGSFLPVDSVEIEGKSYVEWEEAVDQVVDLTRLNLLPGDETAVEESFSFTGGEDTELIPSSGGGARARIRRSRHPVDGRVSVLARPAEGDGSFLKISVTVENVTDWSGTSTRRDEVMGHSLIAVHTMLAVDGGLFVSLLDPPDAARSAVAGCSNEGAFPVLIGGGDVVLSSPIILYDCPEVAPESPGDLYDSTEIDEILALRVLTLTDDEKAEARGTDPRAAAIIDRCDDMPPEMWERLHGAVRSLHPAGEGTPTPTPDLDPEPRGESGAELPPWWDPEVDASVDPWSDSVSISGVEVTKGSAVRLRPSHRSDAQDLFLAGMAATVAGVFKDVDGSQHVAVTIDDDPATEELNWQGRYLFFHPDEVDPIPDRDLGP